MDIFSPTILDNALITGSNNANLLQVSSPSAPSTLFISGSGNVGIGTTTPTTTLNVNGTTLLQGGQTTVLGSGTTSATTALRVENSNATASLVVLDNGNVGISTTTPADLFTINSPSSTGSLRLTHLTEIETLRATSFHSGLCVFIHIPPSMMKLDKRDNSVARIFSQKEILQISPC